ncbi:hypothetical protein Q4E93_10030 [Flavitalea sp. BT771]|uniref:hypothetical protein n=1 Tax=Flavitalea sp. BT771 TaxID=3063329 RepID=UPI0026E114A3|nr:hypothetical protein [Flavitalea sp. BT771]MDO6430926.1 hypothetical protein [Flavitalea sp. BT771]MDV6218934.1 hypothetical protein [Flavitalea sp. BT771]
MQQKENRADDFRIRHLTPEEINNSYLIMREFVEDVSPSAILDMIVTMQDICLTTENVFCGDHKSREDLLYVTRKLIRFIEAAYIQLRANTAQTGKIIKPNFDHKGQFTDTRQLRVSDRTFFKRAKTGPIKVPCITLLGKWLALAGFSPNDEITIASKWQTLLITMNREWDKERGDFKLRA